MLKSLGSGVSAHLGGDLAWLFGLLLHIGNAIMRWTPGPAETEGCDNCDNKK